MGVGGGGGVGIKLFVRQFGMTLMKSKVHQVSLLIYVAWKAMGDLSQHATKN